MCVFKIYFLFLFALSYSSDLSLKFQTYDNQEIFFNKDSEFLRRTKLLKHIALYGFKSDVVPKLELDFLILDNINLLIKYFKRLLENKSLNLKDNYSNFIKVLLCANFFNNKPVLKNLCYQVTLKDYQYFIETKLIQKYLLDDVFNTCLQDLKINFDIKNFLLLPSFLVFKNKNKELQIFNLEQQKVVLQFSDVEHFVGGMSGNYIAFVDGDSSLFVVDLCSLKSHFINPGVSKSCFRFDCNDKNIIFERNQNLSVYCIPRLTPVFEHASFIDNTNSKVDRHIFLKECAQKDRIILVDLIQKKKVMDFCEAYSGDISFNNKFGFVKFNGNLVQVFETCFYKIIKEYEHVQDIKFNRSNSKLGIVIKNKFYLIDLENDLQEDLNYPTYNFDFNFTGNFVSLFYGSFVRILNLRTKKIIYQNHYWNNRKDNVFYDFAGDFAVILRSKKFFLLDLNSEKIIYEEESVDTVKFDTQGNNLAIFYENKKIKIINLNRLKCSKQATALWNDNLILLNKNLEKKGLKIFS